MGDVAMARSRRHPFATDTIVSSPRRGDRKNSTQTVHAEPADRRSFRLANSAQRGFPLSGRQDLNLRPPGPQPGALPDCATPRGDARPSGRPDSNRLLEAWKAPVQPLTPRPQAWTPPSRVARSSPPLQATGRRSSIGTSPSSSTIAGRRPRAGPVVARAVERHGRAVEAPAQRRREQRDQPRVLLRSCPGAGAAPSATAARPTASGYLISTSVSNRPIADCDAGAVVGAPSAPASSP